MRSIIVAVFLLSCYTLVKGQWTAKTGWYSETNTNGIVIQNSMSKGGGYNGPTKNNFAYSHLLFFTRVVNDTGVPFEFTVNFSADSIPIPYSPGIFAKLFLRSDTMKLADQILHNYGVKDLESLDEPTGFQKMMAPKDECLFIVEVVFYNTTSDSWGQERGGNRTELILIGDDLFYRMLPQIDLLPCGKIVFKK